jgi:hypothetical protein
MLSNNPNPCSLCSSPSPVVHRHTEDDALVWVVPSAHGAGQYHTRLWVEADRLAWSCDCRWGASLRQSSRCWHAQLAILLETDRARAGHSRSDDLICRSLRAMHGDPDDQQAILLEAIARADSATRPQLARLLAKWSAAVGRPAEMPSAA